jgi:hypothetical protein
MKKREPERQQLRPLPRDLRRQVQQRAIAQLLLLGWSVTRIARKLHCTDRAIRYAIDKPEFQTFFAEQQREYVQRIDRHLGSLLNGACDALERLLKHSDWRARDAALGHIFQIHGKYVERIDVTGPVRHVQGALVDAPMTDEMRQKARDLLALERQMLQKQLPAKFANQEDHHDVRDAVGRFMPSTNGQDEEC